MNNQCDKLEKNNRNFTKETKAIDVKLTIIAQKVYNLEEAEDYLDIWNDKLDQIPIRKVSKSVTFSSEFDFGESSEPSEEPNQALTFEQFLKTYIPNSKKRYFSLD